MFFPGNLFSVIFSPFFRSFGYSFDIIFSSVYLSVFEYCFEFFKSSNPFPCLESIWESETFIVLLSLKISTFLFSWIKASFLPGYVFSVRCSPSFWNCGIFPLEIFIFSPNLLDSLVLVRKSCFVFGLILLNTSTFLVSITKLLFFPGNIFSVIFSPFFMKEMFFTVGFFEDFDLKVEDLSVLGENLFLFESKVFSINLHHLWITIISLISFFEAYAHLLALKVPPLTIFKGFVLLLPGLPETWYLCWKVFFSSRDLYLGFPVFPAEEAFLCWVLEFWKSFFFDL